MRTGSRKRGPKRVSREQRAVNSEADQVCLQFVAQKLMADSIFASQVGGSDGYMATSHALPALARRFVLGTRRECHDVLS